ncbi:MAG: LrgB family protein [Treponemataceae bacterium]
MHDFILTLTSNPYFGLFLCIITFKIGLIIQSRLKIVIFNPLIISMCLCITLLVTTKIPYKNFKSGADIINLFLPFTTVSLAIGMFNQLALIKKNMLPVLIGVSVGSVVSIASVHVLCTFFGLNDTLTFSLLPKSITTAIALPIAQEKGGIAALTASAVLIAGLTGNVLSPFLAKLFRINNPLATGLGIGTCSHALGTTRAIELGEVEGAFSSIAICLNGIISTIILAFYN